MFWLGAAHAKGGDLIFVEPDSVPIAGDIVQNKLVSNTPNQDAGAKGWLTILDQLEMLHAKLVVPNHGALGGGSLVGPKRTLLAALQIRSVELKQQGVAIENAARQLTAEFRAKYPDWPNMGAANGVRRVYAKGTDRRQPAFSSRAAASPAALPRP